MVGQRGRSAAVARKATRAQTMKYGSQKLSQCQNLKRGGWTAWKERRPREENDMSSNPGNWKLIFFAKSRLQNEKCLNSAEGAPPSQGTKLGPGARSRDSVPELGRRARPQSLVPELGPGARSPSSAPELGSGTQSQRSALELGPGAQSKSSATELGPRARFRSSVPELGPRARSQSSEP